MKFRLIFFTLFLSFSVVLGAQEIKLNFKDVPLKTQGDNQAKWL
jgi:hypothetical protein